MGIAKTLMVYLKVTPQPLLQWKEVSLITKREAK